MKNQSLNQHKLINVLGFSPLTLNVLLELTESAIQITSFNILENIPAETNEGYVPLNKYHVSFLNYYSKDHSLDNKDLFAFGVVGPKSKEILYLFFKQIFNFKKENFPNLIHQKAEISKSAKLDYGNQIGLFSSINTLAEVGFGVTIKTNCHVGHHSKIGDYVEINPGATICGRVVIGNKTLIGAGVIIRDHIKIGSNCIIGMGSNVINDIPNNSIAYGNPCKVHKINK